MLAGDLRRQFVQEVRPLARDVLVDPRNPGLCLSQPVRGLQPKALREGFPLEDACGDFRQSLINLAMVT